MRHFFLLVMALSLARPEAIPAPASIPTERGSTVGSAGGKIRWTAEWTMEPVQENGKPAVHFTEHGHGQYSGYSQPISWTNDALWTADGSFRPLRFDRIVKDSSGRTVGTERKRFDSAKGTVAFNRERDGRIEASKSMQAPADTLALEGLAGIMGFLPFERAHPTTAHLFTNDPHIYDVKFEVRGKERIKTPAGEFECYKVELVPQLGALNILKGFFAKPYFWFSVSPPHLWVRYEGPESGIGTPQITIELQKYEVK